MAIAFDRRSLRRGEFAVVVCACAFAAVTAAVAVWLGADEAIARLFAFNYGVVAGMLALSLVNYALRALRWQLFSRHLGIDVPPARAGLYYLAGFSMTMTPGKVGEALRLWLLERIHGVRYQRAAPLFLADRIGDAIALLLLCLLGLAAFDQYRGALLAAASLVALAVLVLLNPSLGAAAVRAAYGVARRGKRLFAGVRIALRRTARLFDARIFALSLVLGLVGWLAEALAFHWLLTTLGADIGLPRAVFIFAFSMVVGGASMLPGGLGGAEAAMFGLLLVAGVEEGPAVAATAIIRVTTLWFAVGLGFIALPPALRLARARAPGGAQLKPSSPTP
jgi:uncharacterized protein (TIRG00374 family)